MATEKPVSDMSDEEFSAAFEALRNEPVDEVEVPDVVEEETLQDEPSEDDEGTVAEEEPSEPESEEEVGEEQTEEKAEPEEEEAKAEDSVPQGIEGFDFSTVPMDQLLPIDIPVNGIKVKATVNELIEGFKKGMNYTQKMQEIAKHRKSIGILAEHGLNEVDLGLLIDARSGNKEALAKLMSDANVDPLDLEMDGKSPYVGKDYGKEEADPELNYVRKEILADNDFAPIVEEAIQTMPEDMFIEVAGSANNLSALYKDVKSGVYHRVMPEVIKIKNLYGSTKSTKDLYIEVARNMAAVQQRGVSPVVPSVSKENKEAKRQDLNDKRKKAVSTSSAVSKPSVIKQDLDSLDDDTFAKEFAKITGRSINEYK